MAWKVTLSDKSILLDDLSENDFIEATKDYPETTWLRLYMSPGSHPGAFYKLLCACALKMQVPAPPAPTNVKDSVALLSLIEHVEDDLPQSFDEAGLPLESSEDETETTISSTSTELDSGIPNEPDPLP